MGYKMNGNLPTPAGNTSTEDIGPPVPPSQKRTGGRKRLTNRPQGWRKGPFIGQIPYEIENEMFAVYCTLPNLSHVARTTKVSLFTVRKYAKEQDWEGRRAAIIQKARDQADYTLTKATEQSITLVRALKSKVAEKISTLQAQELNTDSLIADCERLVKLEQILLGGVSDRSERINETHEQRLTRLREERMRAIDVTPSLTTPHERNELMPKANELMPKANELMPKAQAFGQ